MAKREAVIFRATITLRDGTVLRASDFGLKAFPIHLLNGTKKKRAKQGNLPNRAAGQAVGAACPRRFLTVK
jgi:hypothetical protein